MHTLTIWYLCILWNDHHNRPSHLPLLKSSWIMFCKTFWSENRPSAHKPVHAKAMMVRSMPKSHWDVSKQVKEAFPPSWRFLRALVTQTLRLTSVPYTVTEGAPARSRPHHPTERRGKDTGHHCDSLREDCLGGGWVRWGSLSDLKFPVGWKPAAESKRSPPSSFITSEVPGATGGRSLGKP